METQGILKNRRFIAFVAALSFIAALYITLNFLLSGGARWVAVTNDIATVLFAGVALRLFHKVWLATDKKDLSRHIWGLFSLGLLFWLIAEAIWGFYEVILGTETPYPSLADIFWLTGYIPLGLALTTRYRALNVSLRKRERTALFVFLAIFILLTAVFVLRPIIAEFDTERVIESILNILYPLADLSLLIMTSFILFGLGHGRFRLTWALLAIGALFVSVSDLFFSYISWSGNFFPDGQADLTTILVLISYALTYLWWAAGIYALSLLLEIKEGVHLNVQQKELTRSNILVILDTRNQIILTSRNFWLLIGAEQPQSDYPPLHKALGVDPETINSIVQEVTKSGSVRNYWLPSKSTALPDVSLSALALRNPQNEFSGCGLVLQATLSPRDGQVPPLTTEQQGLVDSFLAGAGVGVREDAQILKSYFIEQIGALYSLAYEFNGEQVANSLLAFIEKKAHENGWVICVDGQSISLPADCEGQVLIDCLLLLLTAGRRFSIDLASLPLVEQEMRNVDRGLNEGTLRIIDRYGFRSKVYSWESGVNTVPLSN